MYVIVGGIIQVSTPGVGIREFSYLSNYKRYTKKYMYKSLVI